MNDSLPGPRGIAGALALSPRATPLGETPVEPR